MYLQGVQAFFVNICNNTHKNPKVFQKNAVNKYVSKKKAKAKTCIKKGQV